MIENLTTQEYIKLLEKALIDVVDGESAHDLVGMTGFDEEHCQKIVDLCHFILRK
jgi:hypothetical protein